MSSPNVVFWLLVCGAKDNLGITDTVGIGTRMYASCVLTYAQAPCHERSNSYVKHPPLRDGMHLLLYVRTRQ